MDHLLGKPERSVALYHAFVGLIAACGDYTVSRALAAALPARVRTGRVWLAT
jgi:hypothetical protein